MISDAKVQHRSVFKQLQVLPEFHVPTTPPKFQQLGGAPCTSTKNPQIPALGSCSRTRHAPGTVPALDRQNEKGAAWFRHRATVPLNIQDFVCYIHPFAYPCPPNPEELISNSGALAPPPKLLGESLRRHSGSRYLFCLLAAK